MRLRPARVRKPRGTGSIRPWRVERYLFIVGFVLCCVGRVGAGGGWKQFDGLKSGYVAGVLDHTVRAVGTNTAIDPLPLWAGSGEVRWERLRLPLRYHLFGDRLAVGAVSGRGLAYLPDSSSAAAETFTVPVDLYWVSSPVGGDRLRLRFQLDADRVSAGQIDAWPADVVTSDTHDVRFRVLGKIPEILQVVVGERKAPVLAGPRDAGERPTYLRLYPLVAETPGDVEVVHRDGMVTTVPVEELARRAKAGCFVAVRRDVEPTAVAAVFVGGRECSFEVTEQEILADGRTAGILRIDCSTAGPPGREVATVRLQGVLRPWWSWDDGRRSQRAVVLRWFGADGVPLEEHYVPPSLWQVQQDRTAVVLPVVLRDRSAARYLRASVCPGVLLPVPTGGLSSGAEVTLLLSGNPEHLQVLSGLNRTPVAGARVRLRYTDTDHEEVRSADGEGRVPVERYTKDDQWLTRFTVSVEADGYLPVEGLRLLPGATTVVLAPKQIVREVRLVSVPGQALSGEISLACAECTGKPRRGSVPGEFRMPYGAGKVAVRLHGALGKTYRLVESSREVVEWGGAPIPLELVAEERCPPSPWSVRVMAPDGQRSRPPERPFSLWFEQDARGETQTVRELRVAVGGWRLFFVEHTVCHGEVADLEFYGDPAYEDLRLRVTDGTEVRLQARQPGVLVLVDTSRKMDPVYFDVAEGVTKALRKLAGHPKLQIAAARGREVETVVGSDGGDPGPAAVVAAYFDANRADVNADPFPREALRRAADLLDGYNDGGRLLPNRVIFVVAGSVFYRMEEGFRLPVNPDGLELYVLEVRDPGALAARQYAHNMTSADRYQQVVPGDLAAAIVGAAER